jgi:hypothetical protein
MLITLWYGVCGPNSEHMISERRKLRSKELHNLYYSPYATRVLKSKCIIWGRNVARIKEIKSHEKCLYEDLKGRDIVVYIGLFEMIILTVMKQIVQTSCRSIC